MNDPNMKQVRVTPAMAERMLRWLQQAGIVEFNDALTIDDLVAATVPTPELEHLPVVSDSVN